MTYLSMTLVLRHQRAGCSGNGITFKTTLKGMSKLNNAALGDLWIPIASLAALGAALGIGCRDLVRFCWIRVFGFGIP